MSTHIPANETPAEITPLRRALISVSDKTGIVEFAQSLNEKGVEILSTGGTYQLLIDNKIPAIEVSDYTGFPEMMDGRVKTLHPKIHGGILGRRGTDDAIMGEHGISPIDMVVVNLYPFEDTVANPDCDLPTAIENIDIGGPTMVRAAAKNHNDVAIVVNASDYNRVLKELDGNDGQLTYSTRFDLAVKAFEHTAGYDGAIRSEEHTSELQSRPQLVCRLPPEKKHTRCNTAGSRNPVSTTRASAPADRISPPIRAAAPVQPRAGRPGDPLPRTPRGAASSAASR